MTLQQGETPETGSTEDQRSADEPSSIESRGQGAAAGQGAVGMAASPTLLTLTPGFDADQHQMYVDLLNDAVSDDNKGKVHNVALTGRYGSGKSSILEQFSNKQGDRVLKLSLSTLGPRAAGETLTNQIEMELVKRLLHSRPANSLPRSRFQRIQHPVWWKSAGWSVAQVAVAGVLLWLFGWFPHLAGFSSDHSRYVRIGTLALTGLLMAGSLTWAKRVIGDQAISSIGAAGAQVSFAQKGVSFFDEHLAEIVYFFEKVKVDIVVFEDLDRFDDPHIFEELRELNVLLNSPKLIKGRSIRFVYALKDSVFEQLGEFPRLPATRADHDGSALDGPASGRRPAGASPRTSAQGSRRDAAEAEAERANRTKFFDLVVPVVPFITHRNSRDLFVQTLNDPVLLAVSTELIDLTARHITDMRLLKNIRNEYAVFATRLITNGRGMPHLMPDRLFAMIVYKNIHPADFEKIQLGCSALDRLYGFSRDLVREAIAARRGQLRAVDNSASVVDGIDARAQEFGPRLKWFIEKVATTALGQQQVVFGNCVVGTQSFVARDLIEAAFWRALLADGNGVMATVGAPQPYNASVQIHLSGSDLSTLMQDELRLEDWDGRDARARTAEREALQQQIAVLYRGDFVSLAENTQFTLSTDTGTRSFADIIKAELDSTVAGELVRSGYIDLNFALHVAQYYGNRVSIEAMNFIVRHAQPNLPDSYYPFPSPDDVASVLRERERDAGPAFLDQEWPYNIAIVDFLIVTDPLKARTVLDRVARMRTASERDFLDAYLDGGLAASAGVELLAQSWPSIFTQLVETADLSRARRVELVDVALRSANLSVDYDLGEAVRVFFRDHYAEFDCLTSQTSSGELDTGTAQRIVSTLESAGFVCDDPAVLHPSVRRPIVNANRYTLTAANLRVALAGNATDDMAGSTAPGAALSLDTIRDRHEGVFSYCVSNPGAYLAAITDDAGTQWTIADPAAFVDIVAAIAHWPDEHLRNALDLADPGCAVADLTMAVEHTWRPLAAAKRFPATLANVAMYLEGRAVDPELAGVLSETGTIEATAATTPLPGDAVNREYVAVRILNAGSELPDPHMRTELAASISLDDWVDPANVEPEPGPMLSLLIKRQLCEARADLFQRFAPLDWNTLRPAIGLSNDFADFMSPQIVSEGLVADLLAAADVDVPPKVKRELVTRLAEFTPGSSPGTLQAAGRFAASAGVIIDLVEISRIAKATQQPLIVLPLIAQLLGDSGSGAVAAADIVAALAQLGGGYAELATSGRKPKFPDDSDHEAVMKNLRAGHVLTFRHLGGMLHVTVS